MSDREHTCLPLPELLKKCFLRTLERPAHGFVEVQCVDGVHDACTVDSVPELSAARPCSDEQPKVLLRDHVRVHCQALTRWLHLTVFRSWDVGTLTAPSPFALLRIAHGTRWVGRAFLA